MDEDHELTAGRGDSEYGQLEPLLIELAAPETPEPRRAELRERLVVGYLPVARNIARRYRQRGESLADLEQVASIGLLKAVDGFRSDFERGFLAYAVPTITGEIRRHFRDKTWTMRIPRRLKELHGAINTVVPELSAQLHRAPRPSEIAARLQTSAAEVMEALQAAHAYRPDSLDSSPRGASSDAPPADIYGEHDPRLELFTDSHSLAPHIAALPERERAIVIMRFYQDMTQTQIAAKIGVSQMQVSRLLSATLAGLRDVVESGS